MVQKVEALSNKWMKDKYENDISCDICNKPGDVATFPIPEVYEGLTGTGCTTRICMNCLHLGVTAIYKLVRERIPQ